MGSSMLFCALLSAGTEGAIETRAFQALVLTTKRGHEDVSLSEQSCLIAIIAFYIIDFRGLSYQKGGILRCGLEEYRF